jgi:hypothetical protein
VTSFSGKLKFTTFTVTNAEAIYQTITFLDKVHIWDTLRLVRDILRWLFGGLSALVLGAREIE